MQRWLGRSGGTLGCFGVWWVFLLLFHPGQGHATASQHSAFSVCQQDLVAEHHVYSLDFLVFRNLAEGELRLHATDQPGVLRAELIGRTLGVAAWLTGDRTQRYISFMEKQTDGSLRSLSHESQILKRKADGWQNRRKHYRFDYDQRKVFQTKARSGGFSPGKEFDLPAGEQPVDILTGFYNLRAGCYGVLTPGRRLEIPSFSSKGLSTIGIQVLLPAERQELTFFPSDGTLLQVTLDPEVFETTDGNMYIWLNDSGQPARGILENVIGLGDVRGRLRKEASP